MYSGHDGHVDIVITINCRYIVQLFNYKRLKKKVTEIPYWKLQGNAGVHQDF